MIDYNGIKIDLEKFTKIGVKLSGGADSAAVLFLVCNTIVEENREIDYIQPFTVQSDIKPWQFKYSQQVVDWMKQRFPTITFNETLTKTAESKETYITRQEELIEENKLLVQCMFNGITKNPPPEEAAHFPNWDVRVLERDNDGLVRQPGDFIFWHSPVVNFDKRKIAWVYDNFDIHDLFSLTRSCEGYESWDVHCGKCWWCNERKWAFGKLE